MQLSWKKYKILKLLDCFYELKIGSQHEDGFFERQAHSQRLPTFKWQLKDKSRNRCQKLLPVSYVVCVVLFSIAISFLL